MKKWLWCSWRHREARCYPHINPEMGRAGYWHCFGCAPCRPFNNTASTVNTARFQIERIQWAMEGTPQSEIDKAFDD